MRACIIYILKTDWFNQSWNIYTFKFSKILNSYHVAIITALLRQQHRLYMQQKENTFIRFSAELFKLSFRFSSTHNKHRVCVIVIVHKPKLNCPNTLVQLGNYHRQFSGLESAYTYKLYKVGHRYKTFLDFTVRSSMFILYQRDIINDFNPCCYDVIDTVNFICLNY